MSPVQEIRRVPPGTVLDDRFEIVSFLGAGSFGEVYQARQLLFGRTFREVALKLFAANRVSRGNVDDVLSDAITLIGLQEENPSVEIARHLVQVYDMGVVKTPESRTFMSMKLVRGKKTVLNAVRRFEHGGMPVALSLRYLRQLLLPLAWMHTLELPIVHGDLKPDNILLTEDSDLVLTDFGLATRMPVNSLGGAIAYQAPEKLLDAEAGEPSDMYAVGLIWYEMLTGCHPFAMVGLEASAAKDERAFLRAHQASRKWPIRPTPRGEDPMAEGRIASAAEFNDELKEHPQLEAMLNRCLAYEQSKRYFNARVLLADVDKYLANGSLDAADLAWIVPESKEPARVACPKPERTVEARLEDSETLLKQGEFKRAIQAADDILAEDPQRVAALLAKVRALAKLKQTAEARGIQQEAQRLAPQDPDALEALADIFDAEGKPGTAQATRSRAGELRKKAAKLGRGRF